MAKNYLHEGWTIAVPAPTGGVHSGDPILVGGFFGVANYDAEQTLPVEITLGACGNCRRPRLSRSQWRGVFRRDGGQCDFGFDPR